MTIIKRSFYILTLLSFLSACSNPLRTHYVNIQLAILLNQDAEFSIEEVRKSPVDVALIKSADRPVAVIAKAFNELGSEKWISEDKAMLIIKDHRVQRTVGFKNDQLAIFSSENDPLGNIASVANKSWYWEVDWSVGEYGYPVNSTFSVMTESVNIMGNSFNTLHIVEEASYDKANGWVVDKDWANHYWIDVESGLLLKTSQKAAPFSDRFDITFVSTAVRLMSEKG